MENDEKRFSENMNETLSDSKIDCGSIVFYLFLILLWVGGFDMAKYGLLFMFIFAIITSNLYKKWPNYFIKQSIVQILFFKKVF